MKVLFVKDYPKVGKKGELKDVSDGLARNMLIPKGFAVAPSQQVQAQISKEKKDAEDKLARDAKKTENLKNDIEKKTFSVSVKVGEKGQIFGGVREKDIIEVVNRKMGTNFDKTNLEGASHIKSLGIHELSVKLQSGVKANIKINVEPLS